MTHPPEPQLSETWDPNAIEYEPEVEQMPNHPVAADVSNLAGATLFGLSLLEVQQWLQLVALVLGIVATGITIGLHIRRWWLSRKLALKPRRS